MSNLTPEAWDTAIRAVFAKATVDADFRAKCLSDGPGAVKAVTGLDVAPFTFTEVGTGTGIQLPAFGADPDEITELEYLDNVAGGDPGYLHPPSSNGCNSPYGH